MPKEKRIRTSDIWTLFTALNSEFAMCNMCKHKLSYKSTTNNLRKHILARHPTVALPTNKVPAINSAFSNQNEHISLSCLAEEMIDEPESISSSSTHNNSTISFTLRKNSIDSMSTTSEDTNKSEIGRNNALILENKFISQRENILSYIPKKLSDFHPFRIVEEKSFIEFIRALNPNYQIPSRHFISKTAIPSLYEECLIYTKDLINSGLSFCLTTDCWTSRNTESYIAVTVHFINDNFELISVLLECSTMSTNHTSKNLAHEIRRIVHEWGIEKKILLAVSDSANNIKSAISKELGWKHFSCFAHTLNLIVNDALHTDGITEILEKIKIIVGHFKRSYISNEKLMLFQKNNGDQPLKLIQDVPTRWNSTYFMLERFSKLETAIRSTLAVLDKDLPILTVEEWKIINELCQVLKPFEAVTKTISGQKYCSASLIIPLTNGLQNICTTLPKKNFSPILLNVISKLQNGFHVRLGNIESSTTLSICTFLDPRFKMLAFSNTSAAEHAKKIVVSSLMNSMDIEHTRYTNINANNRSLNQNKSEDELSVWYKFDNIALSKPTKTPMSRALIEIQRYVDDVEILPRQENPNSWWKENAQYFPYLSNLAKRYLCALGTSVPCERLFSKA
ncbi:PREDICTED: zinc finger BED domain-containing protein 1-like, partial [Trachymyrmex cornetzi]|uniref:zinc finger BED domain-containing protein 1-like n=1 Tax=Trachymyrmex cornetzi TaxID=471704 RepID=UPI00084F0F5D